MAGEDGHSGSSRESDGEFASPVRSEKTNTRERLVKSPCGKEDDEDDDDDDGDDEEDDDESPEDTAARDEEDSEADGWDCAAGVAAVGMRSNNAGRRTWTWTDVVSGLDSVELVCNTTMES